MFTGLYQPHFITKSTITYFQPIDICTTTGEMITEQRGTAYLANSCLRQFALSALCIDEGSGVRVYEMS